MPVILTMSMRKPISKTSLVFDLLAMITELYIYSMQFTLLETGVMMFYTFLFQLRYLIYKLVYTLSSIFLEKRLKDLTFFAL